MFSNPTLFFKCCYFGQILTSNDYILHKWPTSICQFILLLKYPMGSTLNVSQYLHVYHDFKRFSARQSCRSEQINLGFLKLTFMQYPAIHTNPLHHFTISSDTHQPPAPLYNIQRYTPTPCTTLQYPAIHTNPLHHFTISSDTHQPPAPLYNIQRYTPTPCTTLQYPAIHTNPLHTLQYPAIHTNPLHHFTI